MNGEGPDGVTIRALFIDRGSAPMVATLISPVITPILSPVVTTAWTSLAVRTPPPAFRRCPHTLRSAIAGAPPARRTLACGRRAPTRARTRLVSVPAIALFVPGPPHIVTPPIIPRHEPNDGNAEHRQADIRKRNVIAAMVEGDIFAVHPASAAVPDDIAPGFVSEAPQDFDRIAFGNDIDARELRIRTSAEIQVHGRIAGSSLRRSDAHRRKRDNGTYYSLCSHTGSVDGLRDPSCSG